MSINHHSEYLISPNKKTRYTKHNFPLNYVHLLKKIGTPNVGVHIEQPLYENSNTELDIASSSKHFMRLLKFD